MNVKNKHMDNDTRETEEDFEPDAAEHSSRLG